MFLVAALLSAPAAAGPFTHKAMQGPWPERQVERNLVLPKGWLEVELASDMKWSTSYWDLPGERVRWDEGTKWTYSRVWLNVTQGFSKRLSLYARIPMVHARLVNPQGADTSTTALGDVHTGVILQPMLHQRGIFALQFDLKAPSGVEWPSDFIGNPANVSSFLTGTGTTNLGVLAHGRYTVQRLVSLTGSIGLIFKLPSVVGYVVESDGFGNGWLDPGDELRFDGAITIQLSEQFAVTTFETISGRGTYRMGTSGSSVVRVDWIDLASSSGIFVNGGLGLSWEPSRHWEVGVTVADALYGTQTRTFSHLGLEEFSPQPGLTWSSKVAARW